MLRQKVVECASVCVRECLSVSNGQVHWMFSRSLAPILLFLPPNTKIWPTKNSLKVIALIISCIR